MRANQIVCSPLCSVAYSKALKTKETRQKNKVLKDNIKTKSEWLRDAQKVFNKYIRLRDKDKPCISCGGRLGSKYDAGHFYSVGAHPNMRFNENNVFGQCVYCNQHLHGNLLNFRSRLLDLKGEEFLKELEDQLRMPKHYSIEEIKQIIKQYNQKIKEIQ